MSSASPTAISRALASGQAPANASVSLPATVDENRAIDYATWIAMARAVRSLTGKPDENRVIDCLDKLAAMICHRMEKRASRENIQVAVENLLRKGELDFAVAAIAFADAHDELADAALRNVFAEMLAAGGKLPGQGAGCLQIWAYGQRAVKHAPHEPPSRGHRWHDNWMRNILACWLILFADRDMGVPPTCNRERSKNGAPSGISLVVKALRRHGIDLGEAASVQENIWFGLPGEVVRASARRFASEAVDDSIL